MYSLELNVFMYKYSINDLGAASKPNRRLPGGSIRFRPVSIVLNNDNRRLGFEASPYLTHLMTTLQNALISTATRQDM